jgi:hypothetical protein
MVVGTCDEADRRIWAPNRATRGKSCLYTNRVEKKLVTRKIEDISDPQRVGYPARKGRCRIEDEVEEGRNRGVRKGRGGRRGKSGVVWLRKGEGGI